MSHTPLGEVCLALGLMEPDGVETVLSRLREGGRVRFGEIAIELGLLDDETLARALAHQFRLNMVPRDRLERLAVGADVLELIPHGLIRERLLVPTFLDEEKRVLSLLTVDPTDIPSLRAAQTAARAARLRLFVAPRGAMRDLVERLLPPEVAGAAQAERAPFAMDNDASGQGLTVVFEPDAERASALRRVDALEGGVSEIVGDPEQVSAFIEANQADRVFFRRAVLSEVEPYLAAWRRLRPLVQICALDGYGPGRRAAVPYDLTRKFYFALLEERIMATEGSDAPSLRVAALAREMAEQASLPTELRDAVTFVALFLGLVGIDAEFTDDLTRLGAAALRLRELSCPYDTEELIRALTKRISGEAGPGRHPGAEVLYTALAAVRAAVTHGQDPVATLGGDAARHDARALEALAEALRLRALRARVAGLEGPQVTATSDDQKEYSEAEPPAGGGVVSEAPAEMAESVALFGSEVALWVDAAADPAEDTPLEAGAADEEPSSEDASFEQDPSDLLASSLRPQSFIDAPDPPSFVGHLRKMIAPPRVDSEPAVSGRLSDLTLPELLQTLTLGGRTAQVRVLGGADRGAVQVAEGKLVAARHGPREGENALQSLVAVREGLFEVRFEDDGMRNLVGASEFLLLEALRRRDEMRPR